jgi:hypothetical protein
MTPTRKQASMRTRMNVWCILVLVALLAPHVQAQPYTWELVNLPPPDGSPRVRVQDMNNSGVLLGNGMRVAWRFALDGTFEPILCPLLPRNPGAPRLGPDVAGLNNASETAGDDELLIDGVVSLGGVLHAGSGACTLVQVPGATHTLATAIADDGSSAGWYINPSTVEQGLRRFHGYTRTPGGTLAPLSGLCEHEWLLPEGRNTLGTIVGTAQCEIATDNTSRFTSWVYRQGVFAELVDPNGDDVWVTDVNNADIATAVTASSAGVLEGTGWRIDFTTTPPTWTELSLPASQHDGVVLACGPIAINDLGWVFCTATEQIAGCGPDQLCRFLDDWLAIPEAPPALPDDGHRPPRRKHHNRRWGHHRERLAHWRSVGPHARTEGRHRWQVALDDAGALCLSDGERTVSLDGRREPSHRESR